MLRVTFAYVGFCIHEASVHAPRCKEIFLEVEKERHSSMDQRKYRSS